MTIMAPTDNINNDLRAAALVEFNRATEEARATMCRFENCDRDMHEANAPQSEWHHRVGRDTFDGEAVQIEATADSSGVYTADLWLDGTGDGMSAADLRAEADLYETYPAMLRKFADRLDALNRTVTR